MILTIAIVLGLLVAAYCLLLLLNRRAKVKAVLVVTIDIDPLGNAHIEFVPFSNIEDTRLMKIALLYAAKIRYIQTDPQIVKLYQGLMKEAVTPSDSSNHFVVRLNKSVAVDQAQYKAATKTGERFTIRLVEGKTTDFVHCDIPFRGLLGNFPISALLLAHAVAVRIDAPNIPIFERAFIILNRVMFAEDHPQLFALNRVALDSLIVAKAQPNYQNLIAEQIIRGDREST